MHELTAQVLGRQVPVRRSWGTGDVEVNTHRSIHSHSTAESFFMGKTYEQHGGLPLSFSGCWEELLLIAAGEVRHRWSPRQHTTPGIHHSRHHHTHLSAHNSRSRRPRYKTLYTALPGERKRKTVREIVLYSRKMIVELLHMVTEIPLPNIQTTAWLSLTLVTLEDTGFAPCSSPSSLAGWSAGWLWDCCNLVQRRALWSCYPALWLPLVYPRRHCCCSPGAPAGPVLPGSNSGPPTRPLVLSCLVLPLWSCRVPFGLRADPRSSSND